MNIRALFEMLGQGAPTPTLAEEEWRDLLAFADRTQLTLHLSGKPNLPQWLEQEIEARAIKNTKRRQCLTQAFGEVQAALAAEGIDFILLKGFTHEVFVWGRLPTCGGLPSRQPRVQYDLDILTLPQFILHAREALHRQGYRPHGTRSLSEEHDRPLVRPSNWTWRGDYYDPEMPIPIELHASVWSADKDRIHPAGTEDFWNRRITIEMNGLTFPAFAEQDRLAFAALHVLRHILRHDAKPAHVLELARFLEALAGNEPFWDRWANLHPPELQALQSVSFQFAHEWFGCPLPPAAQLPKSAAAWFRDFAWSPIHNLTGRNKDTVWLHLALVQNWRDRVRVFYERMLPPRLPHHEKLLGRLRYHAGAFAPALASGVRWWWRRDAASTAAQISD